ncbi:MAG TPA: hypothetical protein VN640_01655 [Sphingomicrobium sp.]|jgi:hypothetical protein|nr:hypothetical protein [Sphingomicrobium sp.]
MIIRLAAALLALGTPVAAVRAAPQLSAAEQSQLRQNLELGTLLYRYDQSAWHVTDAMLEALPAEAKARIRGYVTTPTPNGLRTTFFGEGGFAFYRRLYSAVWTGSAITDAWQFKAGEESPLTEGELRLAQARKTAIDGMGTLTMCSRDRPNVIVVPDPGDAALTHVYVMTPQARNDSFPMGGHHRIDVKDGKVVASREFAKSCLELGSQKIPEGAKAAGMLITHLLDPVPTEIHVFTVFGSGLPLYVSVRDGRVYSVEVTEGKAQVEVVQSKR